MLAQKHSSVFHAGVIGHGPRRPPPENNIDKEIIALNKILLIDVIKVKFPRIYNYRIKLLNNLFNA